MNLSSHWVTLILLFALILSLVVLSWCLSGGSYHVHGQEEEEVALARKFLSELDTDVKKVCNNKAQSDWNYNNNLTDANRNKSLDAAIEYSIFFRRIWEGAKNFSWRSFTDSDLRRQFSLMTTLGVSILPDPLLKRYNLLKHSMGGTYGRASVCDFYDRSKCDLSEHDIEKIFLTSRNEEELSYLWFQWRNATGRVLKANYTDFVALIQVVAQMNNYSSATEYELRTYTTETLSMEGFRGQIDSLWSTLRPFYLELHAYVRFKLRGHYGASVFGEDGKIPAHLFGNIWGETWEAIEDLVLPFPGKQGAFNVTGKMVALGMRPLDMVQLAESFFLSLGFPRLNPLFWKNSIFEKPKDREIICHASAWDLCTGEDFRIRQCTAITETDLLTLHHELGHIYYQMAYAHLPKVYRDGANPGFHEAIGDLIALSVQTPTHMESIGLIDGFVYDQELEINYLMRIALTKIAFLPYGLILDKWKWEGAYVEDAESQSSLNCQWWRLREEVQGVGRPAGVPDGEEWLDPASKYHVIFNVPYVRYFISMVLQFQLQEALCTAAGDQGPLHLCSIYNSKAAGAKLRKLLSLGSSQPWPQVLATVTGTTTLSSTSILKYFDPLYKWLKEENRRNGQTPGWTSSRTCGYTFPNSSSSDRPLHGLLWIILVSLLTVRRLL